MRQQVKLYNAEGIATRRGIPDGFAGRKEDLQRFRAEAAERADKIVRVIVDENQIDDPRAVKALEAAVEIIELRDGNGAPIAKTTDRIAAIRVVLDFTKSKPAQKQDISVSKAEDWLASLATK